MYQHRDSSIEIRVSVLLGRSECAGSSLLKRSDFPEFEQSAHLCKHSERRGRGFFSHNNKSKGQTLGCTFALVRSTNIHQLLHFVSMLARSQEKCCTKGFYCEQKVCVVLACARVGGCRFQIAADKHCKRTNESDLKLEMFRSALDLCGFPSCLGSG